MVLSLLLLRYGPAWLLVALVNSRRTGWLAEVAVDWLLLLPLAVVLVGALAETWFTRVLERRHFQALGKMSYSFYLLHLPCLYLAIELLWGRVPATVVFALALGLTLVLAAVFFRYVELPSIALGRRLSEGAAAGPSERSGDAARPA